MKQFSLLLIFTALYFAGFAQTKKVASPVKKTVVLNTDSLAKVAVVNYVAAFFNRNVTFEPTFQLQNIERLAKKTTFRDSLWPTDSVQIQEIITGYTLAYDLYSGSEKVDDIIFNVSSDFKVIDSGLVKLNYAIQLANGELTSFEDAKIKVAGEYPDALWKSITLERGKITHYAHKGYKLGDFLTYYYFDGICKTCSYQIIQLQFDAETGKIASELKIKTD